MAEFSLLDQLEEYRRTKELDPDTQGQAFLDRLNEDVVRDAKEIQEYGKRETVTIPEVNFVQVFLPYFAQDPENLYDVHVGHWIAIAGGPFNSVNVADPSGEILYTVPPIFDNTALTLKPHEAPEAIYEVIGNANNLALSFPAKGIRYMREHLGELYRKMVDKTIAIEQIRTWNAIFTRYGREPIVIEGLEAELKLTPTGNPVDESSDYDNVDYEAY